MPGLRAADRPGDRRRLTRRAAWAPVALALALLWPAPAAAQPAAPSRGQALQAAREIIAAAGYAVLATVAEGDDPCARVVEPLPPAADFTIWLATNPRTRKVAELRRSPRVSLLYFNAAAGEYVAVRGTAAVVTDPDVKAAHWKEAWAPFYEGGPRGPNVVLLKVTAASLEIVSPARGFDTDPATWRPFTVELTPRR